MGVQDPYALAGAGGFKSTGMLMKGDTQGALWNFIDPAGFFAPPGPIADPLSDQLVALAGADWDYFKQNIYPIQQQLIGEATSPRTVQRAIEQSDADVNAQFNNLPAAFRREMQGMGVSVTPEQQASFDKTAELNRGIALVGGENRVRQGAVAQQRRLLGIG